MKRALSILATLLLSLAPAGRAEAQNVSGLRGIVMTSDGEPLPGATVLVNNAGLGISNHGTVTDENGGFRVAPLPPGDGYEVTASFPGRATVTQSDLVLPAGRVSSITFKLPSDTEVKEEVIVAATPPIVDPTTTETSTRYGEEFIEALPILGRNYQDVLTLAPGVSDIDGDGNPNIHGSRDTDVVTLVDGVSTVDPLTGTRGQELNIDSIQEIEVITSGASAEFSRGQGGFINIITKSGGNDFEGSFSFTWRSNLLDGDGAGIDDPTLHGGVGDLRLRDLDFNDLNPSLTLGGPIVRDRAWYFVTVEYRQEEEPVNALTQAFVRGVEETRAFLKTTWQVNRNNKAVFTYTIDPQKYFDQGLDSFTAQETGYTAERGGTNITVGLTTIFTPNVFLETRVQHFSTRPRTIPTTDFDTNGNGFTYDDRNGNGLIEATERDPGEDYDRDRRWDVFEDEEDLDHDGRRTPPFSCESAIREDQDCDGFLDFMKEDVNNNGILDANEDLDGDRRIDPFVDIDGDGFSDHEDRNHNQILDDRPFLSPDDQVFDEDGVLDPLYPYGRLRPLLPDADHTIDGRTRRVTGPYFETTDADQGRLTLRQDLSVFVPEWHGQHDMKFGGIVERESFEQVTDQRLLLFDNISPPTAIAGRGNRMVAVRLSSGLRVFNEASSMSLGAYVSDTYKPLPNLTIGLGLRFDRETTDSFGYSPFDPVAERDLFDDLWTLGGGERMNINESLVGNNDGLRSLGFCADPIFSGNQDVGANPCTAYPFDDHDPARPEVPLVGGQIVDDLNDLRRIASSRLTQHHISTALLAETLSHLFPTAKDPATGEINRDLLRSIGASTFQEEEAFRLTNDNLAPRLSISWDPLADGKTKLFANWSRFYDKLFLATVIPEEGPDPIYRYYQRVPITVRADGTVNNGIGRTVSKSPPSATQVQRDLETPFSDEFTIGFERELAPEVSIRLTYIDRKGRAGLQDIDINHETRCCQINPNTGQEELLDLFGQLVLGESQDSDSKMLNRIKDGRPDLYIHNFFFNQIFRLGNFNQSRYKAIELQLTKRLSRKWQMDASYTYSRARGDAEDYLSIQGDDPATRSLESGYLDFDQRHVVKVNAATFLPGDWQIGTTLQWSTGLPYSVVDFYSAADNYDYFSFRRLLGRSEQRELGPVFIPIRRNSQRNDAVYRINVRAEKAFVMGRFNSKLFMSVDDLLNSDDLRVFVYQPSNRALQLNSTRDFGRRFQVGFEFEF